MNAPADPTDRKLACAFALCGLASLALLANHPSGAAHDFAGVLREEAANQLVDGIVHGGFIFVLAALIVCFLLLARRLGADRVLVTVTLVTFCIGSAALMASMLVDGLVIPAVAARYVGVAAPANVAAAKALFVFAGTLITFLMPLGIAFQSISLLSLGGLLIAGPPRRRAAGIFGVGAGALILAAIVGTAGGAAHVLLGSIVLIAVWYFILAALLWRAPLTG
ncbi:MAG TPA: hypothetical protein VGI91_01500 [Steroidobacteraceae bacterium]|jgi:hypothetical protein